MRQSSGDGFVFNHFQTSFVEALLKMDAIEEEEEDEDAGAPMDIAAFGSYEDPPDEFDEDLLKELAGSDTGEPL